MKTLPFIILILLIIVPFFVFKKPIIAALFLVSILIAWLIFSKSEVRDSIVYTYLPTK